MCLATANLPASLTVNSLFPQSPRRTKKMRRELGIQAYKRPLPEMTPEFISEFGGLSDAEIARRLSVSVSYIRRARIKMEKGSQQ